MKTNDDIASEIKSAVLSVDQSAEIILFGSRARGDFKEDSDWDVLILTDKDEANFRFKKKIRKELFDLQLDVDQVITGIIRNKDIWKQLAHTPFFLEVYKDGKAL